jgi:hypothetical protein
MLPQTQAYNLFFTFSQLSKIFPNSNQKTVVIKLPTTVQLNSTSFSNSIKFCPNQSLSNYQLFSKCIRRALKNGVTNRILSGIKLQEP